MRRDDAGRLQVSGVALVQGLIGGVLGLVVGQAGDLVARLVSLRAVDDRGIALQDGEPGAVFAERDADRGGATPPALRTTTRCSGSRPVTRE